MRRDSLATIRRPGRVTRLAATRIFVFILASAFAFIVHVPILLLILICHGSTHRRVLTQSYSWLSGPLLCCIRPLDHLLTMTSLRIDTYDESSTKLVPQSVAFGVPQDTNVRTLNSASQSSQSLGFLYVPDVAAVCAQPVPQNVTRFRDLPPTNS
ncbi:hypothetical protein KCU86_g23027, partial [Aureobasidium melanogenum]